MNFADNIFKHPSLSCVLDLTLKNFLLHTVNVILHAKSHACIREWLQVLHNHFGKDSYALINQEKLKEKDNI